MKRILGIVAVTLASGILIGVLADGLLNALACQVSQDAFHVITCPDTSGASLTLGVLGGVLGFWFTYTGRLAKLFRKV
jgi:hypothetical protein